MTRYGNIIDISARRDRIIVWDAMGVRHFTENDIPQWVRDIVPGYYLSRRENEMGEVFRYLIKVKHNRVCMFEVDGVVHFNLDGYKKVIDYIASRGCLSADDIAKWRKEVIEKY